MATLATGGSASIALRGGRRADATLASGAAGGRVRVLETLNSNRLHSGAALPID
jgi:hypothetical protein